MQLSIYLCSQIIFFVLASLLSMNLQCSKSSHLIVITFFALFQVVAPIKPLMNSKFIYFPNQS